MKQRVVITGLGAITALGEGAQALWDATTVGRSGLSRVELNGSSSRWQTAAGMVPDFKPEKYISKRKALKVMARDIQLAVAGAGLAIDDAGLKGVELNRERFGVITGSGVLNHELDELASSVQSSLDEKNKLDLKKFGEDGLAALFPLWLLKYLPNMSACHISILFDLQGMNNTLTMGASAGMQAVGEAFRILQRGDADLMLAGGAESKLNPVGISQYQVLGVLAEESVESGHAYCPFDKNAGGFIVGEGAGFLVLETLEHAKKRNAKIYAEITGFGASSRNGQKTAMRSALRDAKIDPKELDYIQACGLGIREEDAKEAEAIREVIGDSKNSWVSASKPVTGFTGFSAGALDLIISSLAVKNQTIPPIMNLNQAQNSALQFVTKQPMKKKIRHAMTNNFGLGGQSVSVVVKAWEEK